jgi:hypothetical protein
VGQKKLSIPRFRVAAAYGWDEVTGAWSTTQAFNADAYVFCLHTAVTHDDYDPLDASQWQFYIAGRRAIEVQAGASMGLTTLSRVAGPAMQFADLGDAIASAGEPTMWGAASIEPSTASRTARMSATMCWPSASAVTTGPAVRVSWRFVNRARRAWPLPRSAGTPG